MSKKEEIIQAHTIMDMILNFQTKYTPTTPPYIDDPEMVNYMYPLVMIMRSAIYGKIIRLNKKTDE